MPNVCLPAQAVDTFKRALASDRINPEKLANMTSEARHEFFAKLVGEGDAKTVNSLFESKMLLKNQERGYLTWAKSVANLKPEVQRTLEAKIAKLDHVLNPAEEKAFLKDLTATKLGADVSVKEAKQIANLSSKVQELEAKRNPDRTFSSDADRMAYGRATVDLGNYISDLKVSANKVALKDLPKQTLLHPVQATSKTAGFSKSIKAAFDDSALLRQNLKTLLTHPGVWAKNVAKNMQDLKRAGINNQDIMREATADVISRPYAKYYKNMGIAPKIEEEFGDPTLITKVPVIGRIYKTTEMAFNAVMLRTRADLADHYIDMAKKINAGQAKTSLVKAVDIESKKEQRSIGKMIGGITGRGDLGSFEKVGNTTNNVFFSPRFVKSQIDTVLHPITGAGGSNFVRQEAAKNLMKIVGATASTFALANAVSPGSVELDPRSSKFGKIKVGDTTFDLTGGFAPIATLAARLYTQQYKSNRGIISKLGDNPSIPKGGDLVEQFITGKLSPAAQRAWVNLVTKEEYNGAKPTAGSNASNLLMPLPVNTYSDAKGDPHAANPLVTEAADALGISANTTNPAQQVKQKLGAKDQGLQDKIGAQKYQEYNQKYNDKLTTFTTGNYYRGLSQEQKPKALTEAENKIKGNLYKQYNYTPPKPKKSDKQLKNEVDAHVQ